MLHIKKVVKELTPPTAEMLVSPTKTFLFGVHQTSTSVQRERIAELKLPNKNALKIWLWDKANNTKGSPDPDHPEISLENGGKIFRWLKVGDEYTLEYYDTPSNLGNPIILDYRVGVLQEFFDNSDVWNWIGGEDLRGDYTSPAPNIDTIAFDPGDTFGMEYLSAGKIRFEF